ncbi:helix-turn-helix domain-containing protein [Streptococcus porcinus]|uniref:Conjugative transposon regulatory protein n=1 Tax=Streptococcus porcinus TaxID=1340 RepID=A0A4V0H799_STRPO|nr:helix-turn-helix transcriptional regulator [Streptococcus porcinus]VTT42128.1 conjugative transposon regulatory protein [Streptococcus porcinus]VTT43577.1 conjugative transposon regulatory protein [Streptococcus porcinus]
MKISYKPLWKLLIDKDLKNKDLIVKAKLSSSTLYKLKHNENVTTDVLLRICEALDCDFSDIMCCEKESE